jgi:hypothetical protein
MHGHYSKKGPQPSCPTSAPERDLDLGDSDDIEPDEDDAFGHDATNLEDVMGNLSV